MFHAGYVAAAAHNLHENIPIAICTAYNSWWWAQKMPETCRVSWQNKFWIFDASSWLFYTKLITMHGHLNIKYWLMVVRWTKIWRHQSGQKYLILFMYGSCLICLLKCGSRSSSNWPPLLYSGSDINRGVWTWNILGIRIDRGSSEVLETGWNYASCLRTQSCRIFDLGERESERETVETRKLRDENISNVCAWYQVISRMIRSRRIRRVGYVTTYKPRANWQRVSA
jgi:hypothetical protein